jgi:hypothetical protein
VLRGNLPESQSISVFEGGERGLMSKANTVKLGYDGTWSDRISLPLQGSSNMCTWFLEPLDSTFPLKTDFHYVQVRFKVDLSLFLSLSIYIYTGCFTTLGHNCRRWFPRSLWWKKFI